MNVRLFDPHPGLMGCPEPLPEPVRKLAADLNGKIREIDDAVQEIQLAAGAGYEARAVPHYGFISLDQRCPDGRENSWRVIRFAETEDLPD